MFQSILVPLDGSTFGEHALPLAISIARRTGASLSLLHAHAPLRSVYVEGAALLDDTIEDDIKAQQKTYLNIVSERIHSVLKDTPITTTLVEGDIGASIVAEADRQKPDLVVMTTHGRGPLSRFWLGSVANELIRQLSMPLLLARPSETPPDLNSDPRFQHILIPLDGTELAEQILEPATAIGKVMEADYTLVRIVKPVLAMTGPMDAAMAAQPVQVSLEQVDAVQEQLQQQAQNYLDQVSDRLREAGLAMRTHVSIEQQPAVAVLDESEKNDINLIAIATHARRGLSRLFLGSVADKVIRGAKVPVLVYRPVEG